MKKCPKCEKEKELVCFYKNKSRYDGLQAICKVCFSNKTPKQAKISLNPNDRLKEANETISLNQNNNFEPTQIQIIPCSLYRNSKEFTDNQEYYNETIDNILQALTSLGAKYKLLECWAISKGYKPISNKIEDDAFVEPDYD